MKIIIVGAGRVGRTLAENLSGESNDITVIDLNRDRLTELQEQFDLRVIVGNGSHPSVLDSAGAGETDMLIAVTSTDEVNMLSCQVAYSMFSTPTKIARIRSDEYVRFKDKLFHNQDMPVDYLLAPEQLVTDHIKRIIEYPGALQVMYFAEGQLGLIAMRADRGGKLVGLSISKLKEHLPDIDSRVAAIFRKNNAIMPLGSTVIEEGDEVYFIAKTHHLRTVMQELQKSEQRSRRIMIAGGGLIGSKLAKALEDSHRVKLIEARLERAEFLSNTLKKTLVLHGDAADQQLLKEEHVENTDLFIAVTNDDEANIMASMLAKRMGTKKTIVLIQRVAYIDLVLGRDVDVAVSPQNTTVSALLRHLRQGDIANVYSLRRGAAEAIELIAHGDEKSSKVIGKTVGELDLPPGTTIGAIVRGSVTLIAHSETVIQADDHVVLFLIDKKYMIQVERLFESSTMFF